VHSDKTEFCNSLKWGTKGENVGTRIEIIVRLLPSKLKSLVRIQAGSPMFLRA
jgi:hypothetical protein